MKILVAVDGSSYTKRMLAYLAAHDEWLGAQHDYVVVHSVPPVPQRAASELNKTVLAAYHAEEAERVFKPIRTFFNKQKINATFVAKIGHPADGICAVANKGKFDLLVMGSHGNGSLANLVMGSVATKVMAHCSTPVLLIR